jgi:hypothetical protein
MACLGTTADASDGCLALARRWTAAGERAALLDDIHAFGAQALCRVHPLTVHCAANRWTMANALHCQRCTLHLGWLPTEPSSPVPTSLRASPCLNPGALIADIFTRGGGAAPPPEFAALAAACCSPAPASMAAVVSRLEQLLLARELLAGFGPEADCVAQGPARGW